MLRLSNNAPDTDERGVKQNETQQRQLSYRERKKVTCNVVQKSFGD